MRGKASQSAVQSAAWRYEYPPNALKIRYKIQKNARITSWRSIERAPHITIQMALDRELEILLAVCRLVSLLRQ